MEQVRQNRAQEEKRKSSNKKKIAAGMEPAPPAARPEFMPSMMEPAFFPEDAPPILRKRRLTKRQFGKFTEQLPLYMAANMSADVVAILQALVRLGDIEAIKIVMSTIGLSKAVPQTVVNLQQNNTLNQVNSGDRTFDTLVRQLDDRDRKKLAAPPQKVEVVDAIPVTE